MAERPERTHLRLVTLHEPEVLLPPLKAEGGQLQLFPAPRPQIIAVIGIHRVDEASFVDFIRQIRPRFVVDVRVSPRFDMGRLNRKSVFSLFRELRASYVDLLALISTDVAQIDVDGLAEPLRRSLLTGTQHPVGPLAFIVDGRVSGDDVWRVVSRSLTPPAHSEWEYFPFPRSGEVHP